MVKKAQRRAELRPHGIKSPACKGCYHYEECGGYEAERSMATCFVETCCEYTGADKSKCTAVCPFKPDFADWWSQDGLREAGQSVTLPQNTLDLPLYIPMIGHGYSRRRPFDWPIVALDTYEIMRVRRNNGKQYKAVATTPAGLREQFRISPHAKVVLRGVAKDPPLERWWEHRVPAEAANQLSNLEVHAAIAPNFSHFLGVPRTDNLYNRRRQLVCAKELAAAGICVLPHLSAIMPADWQFWQRFLEGSPQVRYVAKEFQTGYKNKMEGRKAIDWMARLQDKVNRDLHPVIIGGAQFVEELAIRFARFTVIDSNPFSKAWTRQRFDLSSGKQPWYPQLLLEGMPFDELLRQNVEGYSAWIEDRTRLARAGRG